MQYYPFDSRNRLYRDKIGALAEGETLRLRLLLHNDAKVWNAYLSLKLDGTDTVREITMQYSGQIEAYRCYQCEINLNEGLYWYSFRYTSDYGEFFVSKTDTSLGIVSYDRNWWQQTVYSSNFSTPDWLDGGIIYQIFPDRFFKSEKVKEGVPQDRYICGDMTKQPEYRFSPDRKLRMGNDYYGGDLKGIEEKLDYIASLGVNCIYLNPVFEAHSNHRYNTADYTKIDSLLGNEDDLRSLVKKAQEKGIYIILDGVFSHTGDDSVYFNKYSRYESQGAYQSKSSPYFSWYKFTEYPNKYSSWWGIETLPETNENDLSFSSFITGENGILRYWLKMGVKGWRLDVADELPDEFLYKIRLAVKNEGQDNFLLGEVWEDATNKISYGCRRKFLRGRQLDSVMNYPFSNAIIDFVKGADSRALMNCVLDITENYPPQAVKLLMNHIGTHDTARILTRLGTDETFGGDREKQASFVLSEEQYKRAVILLKSAAVIQYTLPGVPSVFYGDEAGMQGFGDPFCRAFYPWGKEDAEILEFYRKLGKIRRGSKAFCSGDFIPFASGGSVIAYIRKKDSAAAFIAVNCGDCVSQIDLPYEFSNTKTADLGVSPDKSKLTLGPLSFSVILNNNKK